MNEYTNFALVYDEFMKNIPYDAWKKQNIEILKRYGIEDGIVVDLGCGTGVLTESMAMEGYDMIGIDLSEDMLDIAFQKKYEKNLDILYLNQDMREFELYGTCRAIYSRCDSLNYILEYADLVKVFKLVNNYLDPQGIFIFDMNTVYKYEEILGDCTIAENSDMGSFIWENTFYKDKYLNEYDLTLYIRGEDNLYERFEETHIQRAYSKEEILSAIEESGMVCLDIIDADTDTEINKETGRYLFVVREKGK